MTAAASLLLTKVHNASLRANGAGLLELGVVIESLLADPVNYYGKDADHVMRLQVTDGEAPELDVDETNFLPTEPKDADAADDTESW